MEHIIFLIKTVIMGIVEGVTEFLPISSTGHMIIVGNFIGFKAPIYSKEYIDMFEVVIQLGAILAIVVLYWDKISESIKPKNLFIPGRYGFKLWSNMLIAFIPAAVVGVLFNDAIESRLNFPRPVAAALIFGGILMIIIENKFRHGNKTKRIEDVSIKQALGIGLFQCLSLWPGMSRSASTIMGAWLSGLNTPAAADFSFFLAIPTMIAASGYKLIKMKIAMTSIDIIGLAIAFIVSFVVALVVVDKFLGFLKKKPMRIFAIYRIFAGILLLGLAFAKIITI